MIYSPILLLLATFMVLPSSKRGGRRPVRRSAARPSVGKAGRVSRRRFQSALHGKEYRPNQDPPCIIQQPWNNLVVTSSLAIPAPEQGATVSVVDITINSLGTALWKQLGGAQNPGVLFRIVRGAAWLTSGEYFNVTFYDLQRPTLAASDAEITLEDSDARNHYARVGWLWSAADSSVVYKSLNDSSSGKIIAKVESPVEGLVLTHFQVLWRVAAVADPGKSVTVGQLVPLNSSRGHLRSDPVADLCTLLKDRLVL